MRTPFSPTAAAVAAAWLLAACGGGDDPSPAPDANADSLGDTTVDTAVAAPTAQPTALAVAAPVSAAAPKSTATTPTDSQRAAAAKATAGSSVNACRALGPFYWEVGTAAGLKASGSVTSGSAAAYGANTPMAVASASKWLYGAYVVEKRAGQPSADDRKFLSMRAGYVSFVGCKASQTVDQCLNAGNNGDYTSAAEGRFYYNGGHMQKHASLLGLGSMNATTLAAEVRSRLGKDLPLTMVEARPEGGFVTTPAGYAQFLRKVLSGSLRIGGLLGTQAACASSRTCGPSQAIASPVQDDEVFHYSLGHWIEDDPALGDGSFSSAGAFGFYPWINAGKTHYGIVARIDKTSDHAGWDSMLCGRLIRKAWFSGVAQ